MMMVTTLSSCHRKVWFLPLLILVPFLTTMTNLLYIKNFEYDHDHDDPKYFNPLEDENARPIQQSTNVIPETSPLDDQGNNNYAQPSSRDEYILDDDHIKRTGIMNATQGEEKIISLHDDDEAATTLDVVANHTIRASTNNNETNVASLLSADGTLPSAETRNTSSRDAASALALVDDHRKDNEQNRIIQTNNDTSTALSNNHSSIERSPPLPDHNVTHYHTNSSVANSNDTVSSWNNKHNYSHVSACLLFMDDNHRIAEWIAYHYFTLKLRHVIIAVDPASVHLPHIHPYWYQHMKITIWQDSDYLVVSNSNNNTETHLAFRRHHKDTPEQLKDKHRNRQSKFYGACLQHLKKNYPETTSYTTFIDLDEFVVVSDEYFLEKKESSSGKNGTRQEEGLTTTKSEYYYSSETSKQRPNHLFHLLQDFKSSILGDTCIHIPRILYSAAETPKEFRQRNLPDWIDTDQFDTLRYRYRTCKVKNANIGIGRAKAIIDASSLGLDDMLYDNGNCHRPLKRVCHLRNIYRRYSSIPLGIHHYLGSWESYSFRDDARKGTLRTYDKWFKNSNRTTGGADDEIRPWIVGFVQEFGTTLAQELLKDVGLAAHSKNSSGGGANTTNNQTDISNVLEWRTLNITQVRRGERRRQQRRERGK